MLPWPGLSQGGAVHFSEMLLLYNVLSAIAVLLYSPRLFTKKGPEDRKVFVRERLGMSEYAETDIWVHAVSVGEVLACLPFLKQLKREFPDKKIVLTTTTYTGQKIAKERFPEADRIMYMPVDTLFCIKRVVNSLKPELFIAAETELWPELFHELKKAGSRIVILNGRISNSSYRGYRKISFIMKKVLADVDFLYMQTEEDAEKIIGIGAESSRVGVMGNFKFDIDFPEAGPPAWLKKINGRILLAASTHKGEDEILLDAFEEIKRRAQSTEQKTETEDSSFHPSGVKLIIAPRHPERFNEVADLIGKRGLHYIRRSEITQLSAATEKEQQTTFDVILLDTMGELPKVFSEVAIAFIGGSLVPLGGHNVMEPAYWSKPVIFGPHMDNFPIARDFLESNAALEVKDSKDIADAVTDLLDNHEKAEQLGQNAKAVVDRNTGAVEKALELVRGYIGTA